PLPGPLPLQGRGMMGHGLGGFLAPKGERVMSRLCKGPVDLCRRRTPVELRSKGYCERSGGRVRGGHARLPIGWTSPPALWRERRRDGRVLVEQGDLDPVVGRKIGIVRE